MSLLVLFCFLPRGFTNREFRERLAPLLGLDPGAMTPGRTSYHLRRLRLRGLIVRTPRTNRYHVTPEGLRTALFCTRSYNRLLRPQFASIQPDSINPKFRPYLDKLEAALDQEILAAHLVAA